MNDYNDYYLRMEVMMEGAASLAADLFHFRNERGVNHDDERDPLNVMLGLVWQTQQDILLAKNPKDLDIFDAKFAVMKEFAKGIGALNWKISIRERMRAGAKGEGGTDNAGE